MAVIDKFEASTLVTIFSEAPVRLVAPPTPYFISVVLSAEVAEPDHEAKVVPALVKTSQTSPSVLL
jgi:hypothetical protein